MASGFRCDSKVWRNLWRQWHCAVRGKNPGVKASGRYFRLSKVELREDKERERERERESH